MKEAKAELECVEEWVRGANADKEAENTCQGFPNAFALWHI